MNKTIFESWWANEIYLDEGMGTDLTFVTPVHCLLCPCFPDSREGLKDSRGAQWDLLHTQGFPLEVFEEYQSGKVCYGVLAGNQPLLAYPSEGCELSAVY